MTAVLQWQEGLGLGRSSSEDVHSLGRVTEKFGVTVMLGVPFVIKMCC